MKISISNIAWDKKDNNIIYKFMLENKIKGLEIAPTQLVGANPYEKIDKTRNIVQKLRQEYNIIISSMQSIWYGRQEKMFFSDSDRAILLNYTKKAIDFAASINCKNLVFGSPKNRILQKKEQYKIAVEFFQELACYAEKKNTCIAIEANPTIYNTNFINNHKEALEIIKDVNSEGFKMNFDFGTLIANNESVYDVENYMDYINHIHISEPYLNQIKKRKEHEVLACILKEYKYDKYISIEMKNLDNVEKVKDTLLYVNDVFM